MGQTSLPFEMKKKNIEISCVDKTNTTLLLQTLP